MAVAKTLQPSRRRRVGRFAPSRQAPRKSMGQSIIHLLYHCSKAHDFGGVRGGERPMQRQSGCERVPPAPPFLELKRRERNHDAMNFGFDSLGQLC